MKLWLRLLPAGLAALLVIASCSLSDGDGSSASSTGASTTTTSGPVPTVTTAPGPDGPYAPEPDPPVGPLPSFNESAGCGVAQGIRGPYAAVAGDLADDEAIRGPWGDLYGRTSPRSGSTWLRWPCR